MSSRWPQGQQDQRSPYATYDEAWPPEDGSGEPWQDDGWQASDQFGYGAQWTQAQGSARAAGPAVAQAVAEPRAPGRAAGSYQREWDQSAGGFGDDADLEWFQYLSGGRSTVPKPDAAPPPRRSGRPERPRSRRGKGRPAQADPGPTTDPGSVPSSTISGPYATPSPQSRRPPAGLAAAADPGRGRGASPDAGTGRAAPPTGRTAARRRRHGRHDADGRDAADRGRGRAAAEPRYDEDWVAGWPGADAGYDQATATGWPDATGVRDDQAAAPGWSAVTDPRQDDQAAAPGWPVVTDPGQDEAEPTGWPDAADPGSDRGPAAGWAAADSGHDPAALTGWPAADSGYDQAGPAGWPAADSGYDPAALAGWPAVTDPGQDEAEPTGWPDAADPGSDRDLAAGWPAAESGYAPATGWPSTADAGYEWPATAQPQDGQAPATTGWPATDTGFGWSATNDSGYAQPVAAGWPTAADAQPPAAEARAGRAPARQRPARKPPKRAPARQAPAKRAPAKKRASAKAAPTRDEPRLLAGPDPEQRPGRQAQRPKSTQKSRGRLPVRVLAIAGASVVLAGAAGAVVLARSGNGVSHVVTTPTTLGAYTEQPRLAVQMKAATLRQQILNESAGEAHNVLYAVYEDSTGPAAASGPQIILFIGGNLSGTSAGSFIRTFTGKLQGAVTTSAGSLGGAAACVPSVDGRVAECVWADNDTFGVVASQTLSTTGLANEMRQMRPLIEHQASTTQ